MGFREKDIVDYDPYKPRLPRGKVVATLQDTVRVHPLLRESKKRYFQKKNKKGYQHDLGAMDVFLDNFGMLVQQQFDNARVRESYFAAVENMMFVWECLGRQVLQREPYWGEYINSRRQAQSGEPRGLLRLYQEVDWSKIPRSLLYPESNRELPEADLPPEPRENIFDGRRFIHPGRGEFEDAGIDYPYADWDSSSFFSPDFRHDEMEEKRWEQPGGFGIILPPDMSPTVETLELLPPRESTPDLPLRVGREADSLPLYQQVHRDQRSLGTCAAHAVCMGLDLLAARNGERVQFSPSWLHCCSGREGHMGRTLSSVIDAVSRRLPCEEREYPYEPQKLQHWKKQHGEWQTAAMIKSSNVLSARLGIPIIKKLERRNISSIKAHLASGWLVIAATAVTNEMFEGYSKFGHVLAPIKGQTRADGHAWLLVGYDHIDGNDKWKYQGHFLVLNSWKDSKESSPLGRGVCTLPFVTLLTNGIEVFAIRLRSN